MQVRPGTAGDMARAHGVPYSPDRLYEPRINIALGQGFIESIR